jgi:hypothetical protein
MSAGSLSTEDEFDRSGTMAVERFGAFNYRVFWSNGKLCTRQRFWTQQAAQAWIDHDRALAERFYGSGGDAGETQDYIDIRNGSGKVVASVPRPPWYKGN